METHHPRMQFLFVIFQNGSKRQENQLQGKKMRFVLTEIPKSNILPVMNHEVLNFLKTLTKIFVFLKYIYLCDFKYSLKF